MGKYPKKIKGTSGNDQSGNREWKNLCLYAYVVVKTSNLVISRRRYAEDRKDTC